MHPAFPCLAAAIALALSSTPARADDAADRSSFAARLDRLTVVGSAARADQAAGSAHYIDQSELEEQSYTDIQRVLRAVPGVYAIDEEGYGLRPNIGIRGSGTDRNSRITVMEDGVLVAPAAYAAPAAYYFPTMARMSAVEIRKGSAAILAGPRTTGGAINLLSTPVPASAGLAGLFDVAYGSDDTVLGHGWIGGSGERAGFLLETVQQQSDGFKHLDVPGGDADTGYELEDYVGKLRVSSDPNARYYQELELKLGSTGQDGEETYLGLTDADFAADPLRRYAASQVDNIATDHEQAELRHRIELGAADLTTVAYRHEFARAWYKLNDVQGSNLGRILADPAAFADEYAWITGADSPDDALTVRNNNRAYEARGVQSVLGWNLEAGSSSHDLQVGLRWHEDSEDRFQNDDRYRMDDGTMVRTSAGAPGSQDNRVGEAEAWSLYAQDEIRFGRFILTPGFRYEHIDLLRTDYARTPDGRTLGPTRIVDTSTSAFTPGIGATWLASETLGVFASVHKGFNPAGPGSDADPEESLNTELGVRYGTGALQAELVGFHNDYSNLVGSCTASTGGGCTIGDEFDGGEATVRGIEASLGFDAGEAAGWTLAMPLRLAWTRTHAEFDTSFDSDFGEWGDVVAGDELPYLPEHLFHASVGLEGERWRVHLAGNYLDAMRTVAGQGTPSPEGRTDEAWLFDLSAGFSLTATTELYARIENLADEEYIASRRPAGARPGRPRAGFVGVRVAF